MCLTNHIGTIAIIICLRHAWKSGLKSCEVYLNGSHKQSTSVVLKILELELPPVPNIEITGEIGEGFLFLLMLHQLM